MQGYNLKGSPSPVCWVHLVERFTWLSWMRKILKGSPG